MENLVTVSKLLSKPTAKAETVPSSEAKAETDDIVPRF